MAYGLLRHREQLKEVNPEDVVQDVFCDLLHRMQDGKIDPKSGDLRGYLYKLIRRRVMEIEKTLLGGKGRNRTSKLR